MLDNLRPQKKIGSVYDFDFRTLYGEGIRGLLFDIDNTLVMDNAPASRQSDALLIELAEIGFKIAVISNNSRERCEKFCAASGVGYYSMAMKPSAKAYIKAMHDMELLPGEIAAFGDQLFTDIAGANKAGVISVLTAPIDLRRERIHIKIKRIPEKLIMKIMKI